MDTNHQSWSESLYHNKASGLILYGRALGLSHNEAEDVLQETFIALLNLENKPEEPERYCLRAFRNRALNYRRSLWRRVAREFESARRFERPSVDDETETQAVAALKELPPEQREVIVLKIWHKMTFDEIGRALDISPNTIAGRYRYGISKLKFLLLECRHERDRSFGKTIGIMDTPSPVA